MPQTLSSTFSEVLDGVRVIAASPEFVARAALLTGADAETFVDILDKVSVITTCHSNPAHHTYAQTLNMIDGPDRLRRKAFDLQRRICGLNRIIPHSFTLMPETLQLLSDRPEASGGFADIWRGRYNGRVVAFKVFRAYRVQEVSGSQEDLKVRLNINQ